MTQKTPLYAFHQAVKAHLINFSGWEMPLHYGSQITEHLQVRQNVGMFDVSHMGILEITGKEVIAFLRYVLANDVARLATNGTAFYTCMLNPQGGIIDDLIVYRIRSDEFRLVLNAARRQVDMVWLKQCGEEFQVTFNERCDLAMLAIQGPKSLAVVQQAIPPQLLPALLTLKPFHTFLQEGWQIARTGYTGEDGVEIILPHEEVIRFWQCMRELGVTPCGLGARDTLRLEAGLNLYGMDMDETTSPLESNLAWTVSWQDLNRQFIGKEALLRQKERGLTYHLVGLTLENGGVLRQHQRVIKPGVSEGLITSGTFSPTLGYAIAFARVPMEIDIHTENVKVERRGELLPVQVVKLPFVQHGKKDNRFGGVK